MNFSPSKDFGHNISAQLQAIAGYHYPNRVIAFPYQYMHPFSNYARMLRFRRDFVAAISPLQAYLYQLCKRLEADSSSNTMAYIFILLFLVVLPVAYTYYQTRPARPRRPPNPEPQAQLFPGQGLFACVFWRGWWRAGRAGDVQGYIRDCFEKTGLQTFRTTSFIQKDTVHTIDRQNLRHILTSPKLFGKGPRKDNGWFHPSWAPFLEGGMLVSDGQEWQSYRKAARLCLETRRNGQHLEILEPFVQRFLDGIRGDGENRDYQDDIINFSKDAALGFLMGWDHNVSKVKWDAIREDADYCSHTIYRRFRKTALEHLFI